MKKELTGDPLEKLSSCEEYLNNAEESLENQDLIKTTEDILKTDLCINKLKEKDRPFLKIGYLLWPLIIFMIIIMIFIVIILRIVYKRTSLIKYMKSKEKIPKKPIDNTLKKLKFSSKLQDIEKRLNF